MKFIITADDYGASPIIDDAIQTAVANGYVTNVAGFANGLDEHGKFSVQKLKNLKATFGDKISVGCHFTVTSGKAVNGPTPTLTRKTFKKEHFKKILTIEPADIDPEELKAELEAQIQVFEDAELPIEHFSDHVGILTLLHRTSRVYFEVVQGYNQRHQVDVPIRNPVLSAAHFKDGCLDNSAMYSRGRLGNIKREVSVTLDAMEGQLEKLQAFGLKTTDYFVEHLWNKPEPEMLHCILMNEQYEMNPLVNIRVNPEPIVEVVTHLALSPMPQVESYTDEVIKLGKFGGINLDYLKGNRAKEYEMMMDRMPTYVGQADIQLCTF